MMNCGAMSIKMTFEYAFRAWLLGRIHVTTRIVHVIRVKICTMREVKPRRIKGLFRKKDLLLKSIRKSVAFDVIDCMVGFGGQILLRKSIVRKGLEVGFVRMIDCVKDKEIGCV